MVKEGFKFKVLRKKGKQFVIPEREFKTLRARGKLDPEQEQELRAKEQTESVKRQVSREGELESERRKFAAEQKIRGSRTSGDVSGVQEEGDPSLFSLGGLKETITGGFQAKTSEERLEASKRIAKTVGIAAVTIGSFVPIGRAITAVQKSAQVGKGFLGGERIAVTAKTHPNLSPSQRASLAKELGRQRIRKIADATIAGRYPINGKSIGLTKSIFGNLGLTIAASGLALSSIGTYPFAGFIKEEALQTLSIGFFTAEKNNDIGGMELAIQETEEILNAAPSIIDKVPFANVVKQLNSFFKAAKTKLEIDKRSLEIARGTPLQ